MSFRRRGCGPSVAEGGVDEGGHHGAASARSHGIAPLAATRSPGEIGKTTSGAPAAAKTTSWTSKSRSMKTGRGSWLPNGATPPMENPVDSRTRSASGPGDLSTSRRDR